MGYSGDGLSEQMISGKSLQSLRLPEPQTAIATSALATRECSRDVRASREIAVRMYDARRPNPDRPDVFAADQSTEMTDAPVAPPTPTDSSGGAAEGNHAEREEGDAEEFDAYDNSEGYERDDADGATFLVRPNRPASGRNQPWQMIAATRGSIANFEGLKNGETRGKGNGEPSPGRIRCDAADQQRG